MNDATTKLSVVEKVAYAVGDTANNLTYRAMTVFLTFFYTDVFGISAKQVGTLFLLSRFFSAFDDLAFGVLADRTRTRWGKFRPWILFAAIPFGGLTILTFSTPNFSASGKLVYAYATYIALMTVYSASNVSYGALSGVMTADPVERTRLSAYRFVFAFLGALLVQGLFVPLTGLFGQGDRAKGSQLTIGLFAIVSTLLFLFTFARTRERVSPPASQRSSLRQDLKNLGQNRPWQALFLVGMLFVGFATIRQGVTMYYFIYYVGREALATPFMVSGLLAGMAGAAATGWLTSRFGKRVLFSASMALSCAGCALLFFLGPDNISAIFACNIGIELAASPMPVLFFAMLADTADYSEWTTRRRATGIVFSAGSFSMRFGVTLAGAVNGWLLGSFGYIANQAQTSNALLGIRLLMSLIPATIAAAGFVALRLYRIDDRLLRTMQTDLEVRRSGAQEVL
jgi:GPH family glycoside/pentoside/hexuronide:cation symporter